MKKRDFGMAGSDFIGTKIALNFVLKGLTFPNYIITVENKRFDLCTRATGE